MSAVDESSARASNTLVLGTRGSALALWQAKHVAELMAGKGAAVSLSIIKTQGDKIQDVALAKIGGKGLFVKEIEEALLARSIDFAVHSMKDVPTALPEGLSIVAISRREDPSDALCLRSGLSIDNPARPLDALPVGARVGTSSLRRVSQLKRLRPDLQIEPLRGNVDTRLGRLARGEYDAIVLATAGLTRLGLSDRISARLSAELMLPAIAQGALGIECRSNDQSLIALVRSALHDPPTALCVAAERALLATLEGGCQTPIAAHATLKGDELVLVARVAREDGTAVVTESEHCQLARGDDQGRGAAGVVSPENGDELADRLGRSLGRRLLARADVCAVLGRAPTDPASSA